LPRAWATSSKDGWSLQAIPRSPARAPPRVASQWPLFKRHEKDASHRLLQPTRYPSTLWTARFPGALPAVPRGPCGRPARQLTRAHARPTASCEPLGEASLDGEPPASALPQPVLVERARVTPIATRRDPVVPRGPGGASIERSSALHLPAAAFSTASRAYDVASDTLCRDRSEPVPPFGTTFPARSPGTASAAVSSKTTASSIPGRLPSTSAVSPAEQPSLSRRPLGLAPPPSESALSRRVRLETQDPRQPATVLTALPPRAGFGHPFAAEHVHEARGR